VRIFTEEGYMKEFIKFGIIGCGQASRVAHGPTIKKDRRAKIIAVSDPDDENRMSFKKKFRVPADYRDYRDMLSRENLDAVIIASPPWAHYEQFKDSIDANLHILCEKPLANTVKDCSSMMEMAAAYNKIIQIGHSKRFEHGFQKMKKILESGTLGDLYQMSIYWHYYVPDFRKGWIKNVLDRLKRYGFDLEKKYGVWRYFDKRVAGGDFFDHAPHYIDLMRFFLGEVESIYCKTRKFIKSRVHEDLAAAIFTLSNGMVAVMEKSTLVVGRPNGFEKGHVYAEKGKLAFEAFQEYTYKPMKLRIYRPLNIIPNIYMPKWIPRGKKNTLYYRQMKHFIDRVTGERSGLERSEEEVSASVEDAAIAVAWTLAGYRSAEEGREILRDEIFSI
jgi:predicted dehydrogenase